MPKLTFVSDWLSNTSWRSAKMKYEIASSVVADSGCYYAVAGKIYPILVQGDYSSLREEIAIPEIDAISSSRSMIELAREISSPVWYESGSKRMII